MNYVSMIDDFQVLCSRHSEQTNIQQHHQQSSKFEHFSSFVNIETIKNQIDIVPDIIDSVHTYWLLKRKVNIIVTYELRLYLFFQKNADQPFIHISNELLNSDFEPILPDRFNVTKNILMMERKPFFDRFGRDQRIAFEHYEPYSIFLIEDDKNETLC